MLMPRPADCLARVFERLRPGGRVAMAVFDSPPPDPSVATVFQLLRRELGSEKPDPKAPGMFRLSDKAELQGLFKDAGFQDVQIETVSGSFPFATVSEYIIYINDISNETNRLLSEQTEERKAYLRGVLQAEFEKLASPGLHSP